MLVIGFRHVVTVEAVVRPRTTSRRLSAAPGQGVSRGPPEPLRSSGGTKTLDMINTLEYTAYTCTHTQNKLVRRSPFNLKHPIYELPVGDSGVPHGGWASSVIPAAHTTNTALLLLVPSRSKAGSYAFFF